MIEPEMARRFIEQVTQYTEYNINIMDERGVIIASRDPARVGTYHEVADRIIHGREDVLVIRDDKMFPGVLPGINMAVMLDGFAAEAATESRRREAATFSKRTMCLCPTHVPE